jgi:uncharacterized protein YlxP (DUF503 family)
LVVVGVLKIKLRLPGVASLKEKRGVVKSLVEKTRHKFNASVAEVGRNDEHQRSEVGISVVGNDSSHVNSMLDKILDSFEESAIGRADVIDTELELVQY